METKKFQLVKDIPGALLETYLSAGQIAVDSELQGLRLGRDQVCLVQLCDPAGNVCLVQIQAPKAPKNLARLLTDENTLKVFHYALSDVAFLKASLDIAVKPFHCTKVMSKLVRTYTDAHGLRHLVQEHLGTVMNKESQSSDWSRGDLTPIQLEYAANDVLYLLPVYNWLLEMVRARGKLPSGITAEDLNAQSQAVLPTLVNLFLSGYGDRDGGWETGLFAH